MSALPGSGERRATGQMGERGRGHVSVNVSVNVLEEEEEDVRDPAKLSGVFVDLLAETAAIFCNWQSN